MVTGAAVIRLVRFAPYAADPGLHLCACAGPALAPKADPAVQALHHNLLCITLTLTLPTILFRSDVVPLGASSDPVCLSFMCAASIA